MSNDSTMTKAQLRQELQIGTSQLNALLSQLNINNKDFFNREDLDALRQAMSGPTPTQEATTEPVAEAGYTYQPQDLGPLAMGIVKQVVEQDRLIAEQITPYVSQRARISRILAFVGQGVAQSDPVEVEVPVLFSAPPKALKFDASLI